MKVTVLIFVISFFLLHHPSLVVNAEENEPRSGSSLLPSYTVCNGMSNQLLGHFSALSQALMDNNNKINMPNAYIFNGVQSESTSTGKWEDVLPTSTNSIPLDKVFDINKIRKAIHELSADAKNPIDLNVVPIINNSRHNRNNDDDDDDSFAGVVAKDGERDESNNEEEENALSCDGWLSKLSNADPASVLQILGILSPSPLLQRFIDRMVRKIGGPEALENGVCLHHRDGADWHSHCKSWENIPDGVWRKNCLAPKDVPLGKLVKDRLLEKNHGDTNSRRTLFYVGDHDPPVAEISPFGFDVVSRSNLLGSKGERELLKEVLGSKMIDGLSTDEYRSYYRDLWAVIDFFTCSQMGSFVGNSVSTWSTLQLALRNGKGTWYNSRSIPLAGMLPLFPIPIVYTYTEQSQLLGKLMMQASILSARQMMGDELIQPIHVLYHGKDDEKYLRWLKSQGVIIHNHEPKWIDMIERLRLAGNAETSHLFKHAGNYLGTWQRIDIPDLIEAEYALLLDADTIVTERFTLADFGLEITPTISFSLEAERDEGLPWNAGVALMNVPKLRETKREFMNFIAGVEAGEAVFSAPSDQGAYLDFYHPDYLDRKFNIKAYFNDMQDMKVLHFHGPKPFELFQLLTAGNISPLMTKQIQQTQNSDSLCLALHKFSISASVKSDLIPTYCTAAFEGHDGGSGLATGCIDFMKRLSLAESSGDCHLMATAFTNADISLIRNTAHQAAEPTNLRFSVSSMTTPGQLHNNNIMGEWYSIPFAFLALSIYYFFRIKWSIDQKKSFKDPCATATNDCAATTTSSSSQCRLRVCLQTFGLLIIFYQALTLFITGNMTDESIFLQRPFWNSNHDDNFHNDNQSTHSIMKSKLDGLPVDTHQRYICKLLDQVYGKKNAENEVKVMLDYEAGPFTNLGKNFHCNYPGSPFEKAEVSIDAEVMAVDSRAPYFNKILTDNKNKIHSLSRRTSFCPSKELSQCVGNDATDFAININSLQKTHDPIYFLAQSLKTVREGGLSCAFFLIDEADLDEQGRRHRGETWTRIAAGKGIYHWDFWINEENNDWVLEDTKTEEIIDVAYVFRNVAKRIDTKEIMKNHDNQELICFQPLPKADYMYQ